MIRQGALPTETMNDGIVRQSTVGPTLRLVVQKPQLGVGEWIIGVVGSMDTTFRYILQASVYHCPNNCSFHGSCNLANNTCTCEPNWQGTSDCSLNQIPLPTDGTVLVQRVEPAAFGYFVAVITSQLLANAQEMRITVNGDGVASYPRVYLAWNRLPNASNYDVISPAPATQTTVVRLSQRSLLTGSCYIGIYNPSANYQQQVSSALQFDVTCPGSCSGHGTCNTNTKQCQCDGNWAGVACDVDNTPQKETEVSPGTVVAISFVSIAVGLAIGIFLKRQFPRLCDKREQVTDMSLSSPAASDRGYTTL